MDPYITFFIFGSAGLIVMAVLGVAGSHSHESSGGHSHDLHLHGTGGHGHGHSDVGLHHTPTPHSNTGHAHVGHGSSSNGHGGHASAGQHGQHSHANHHGGHHESHFNLRAVVLGWLSPRVLLTMSMGVGATGVLLASVLPGEPLRGLSSLAGAVALEKLVVSPIWNVLTRFASTPARTLESAVFEEATAITGFDASGCGLVSINLDGHEMRLLGRLAAQGQQQRVCSGDTLIVESVDGARGQCVVSPLKGH